MGGIRLIILKRDEKIYEDLILFICLLMAQSINEDKCLRLGVGPEGAASVNFER